MPLQSLIPQRALPILAVGLLALAPAAESLAEGAGKIATCRVESAGKVEVNGPCRFRPDGGAGSFTLENRDRQKALYGSILSVTVSVVSPGMAEVRGLTRQGVNSRWGEAKRSNDDRACWIGADFKICAR